MSGFVGIVNLDGAPADQDLIWRLTRAIGYRGPDAQEIWVHENIAFGHTMLRTTLEAEREHQPCSLDGKSWITADCRIDARGELIRVLETHGRPGVREVTDPELILHAYAVWGTNCVNHLIGDFAFAIWDAPNRRLFCARDHLGVKLFYYARKGNCLIFGNTLNSVRLHPAVSNQLNDSAIADFLLFGHNQELATTSFQDVQRLPPAHSLTWPGRDIHLGLYWNLPIDPPLRFARRNDYIDHFLDLFRTVVRDRLRTDSAAILMSGGLDSTAIAAIAKELSDQGPPASLSAHTVVFDRLLPHEERRYAALAAEHLQIPIYYEVADDYALFDSRAIANPMRPEPIHIPDSGPPPNLRELGTISRHSRVALFGEGPDNALHYEWKPYVRHEIRHRKFASLGRDAISFPFVFGQIPFYTRFSGSTQIPGPVRAGGFELPEWLNASFVAKMGLHQRFERVIGRNSDSGKEQPLPHPVRPIAYASLTAPLWQFVFETYDGGISGVPVEVRHPFADIRMLRYFLAVPVIPWCRGKYLMRQAMKALLPPEIIRRPKAGLPGFPAYEQYKLQGLPANLPTEGLDRYINVRILRDASYDAPNIVGSNLRAYKLSIFLRTLV